MLGQLSNMSRSRLLAISVFLVGAWAVLFKTLYVATAANSRLTADFLAIAKLAPARSEIANA